MMQTTNFLRGFPRKEEVKVKQELCQTEGQRAKSMQRVWDSGNLSPSCFVLFFLKASTKVVPDRSLFPRGGAVFESPSGNIALLFQAWPRITQTHAIP